MHRSPAESNSASAGSPAPGRCIACGASPERGLRLRNGTDLLQCPNCRLAWWRWPPFEPQRLYDQDYFQSSADQKGYADYASLEDGIRRTARSRLRRIERLLNRPGAMRRTRASLAPLWRLVEIGCGTGLFLDEARGRGWETAGLEISAYAARVAQERGLNVQCGTIDDVRLEAGGYDCVAMWDVIEHLERPAVAIAIAARALRPGGVLALSTGDVTSLCARLSGARWHLFNLPEHLFFFSPAALRRLLESAGCAVHTITREVYWSPLSYALERLGKSLSVRGLEHAPRWTRRLLIPATLLDVVGVYAVRLGEEAEG